MHEGELDPRLKFTQENVIEIGNDEWHFPVSFITAMSIAVVLAPENINESIEGTLKIQIAGSAFSINEIWGKKDKVQRLIFGDQ